MIWIVGNKGMLGSELSRALTEAGIPFTGSDREVSFLDYRQIEAFATSHKVSAVVNCAAYTAVDKAEDEPEFCEKLNVDGPKNLAKLTRKISAKLIHISTDYVFSGKASEPYREDDEVDPQGVYGRTKAEGERTILKENPESLILRTAWLYGEFGGNFVYTMLKLMGSRDEVRVVSDQVGSPTWARDLAGAIVGILKRGVWIQGIFHFTNEGMTSWYEFAQVIYREGRTSSLLTKPCTIVPITTDQYPTKAKRPMYSVLSKEKIKKEYGIVVPHWEESLYHFLESIKKKGL
jgi:dTDP-4-dehydrorhamnose reductase